MKKTISNPIFQIVSLVLLFWALGPVVAEPSDQAASVPPRVEAASLQGQAPQETAPGEVAGPASGGEEASVWHSFMDSIINGKLSFDLRARVEIAEQEGLDTSQAYTERLRLGYGTKPFYGFSGFLEFEDTRSADEDLYNAAGLNGEPGKTVIADPENTELNRAFIRYDHDFFTGKIGRQRIILDDARFVGNVGWRQNEQTYDALTIQSDWVEDLSLYYGYIDEVNRIFGPDAGRDFKSDSHLIRASYSGLPVGTLTGFGYLIDLPNSDVNSSNTVGLRLNGTQKFQEEKLSFGYILSYAYQVDAGDNPNDYKAHYLLLEGNVGVKGVGTFGVGYEVLSSDGGAASFSTPLATLHKFNGWADKFLVTPPDGLEDLYAYVRAPLPWDMKFQAVFHMFFSEDRSRDFGVEFDAALRKAITKNLAVLAKLAVFEGESVLAGGDIQRYWLQAELKF